jgi:excisionase family DNA binding protein
MKWKLKSELNPRNPEINHFSETSGIHRSDEETLDLIAKRIIEKVESNQKHFFDVFTINEVAELLKVSKRTIEGHLYEKRDLAYLKIGRKVRITRSDLLSFLGFVS